MECRFCHCHEQRACVTEDGPCYWHKPGYCSACAEKHLQQLVEAVQREWARCGTKFWDGSVGGWRVEIGASDKAIHVRDHIGALVFLASDKGVYLAPQYDAPELLPLFQEAQREAA